MYRHYTHCELCMEVYFCQGRNQHQSKTVQMLGLLNKLLLSHPEIISTKTKSPLTSKLTNSPSQNIISNDNSIASGSSSQSHDNSLASDNDNNSSNTKHGIDVDEINISEGFAGETLCTIIRKLQRDKQTLENLKKKS